MNWILVLYGAVQEEIFRPSWILSCFMCCCHSGVNLKSFFFCELGKWQLSS